MFFFWRWHDSIHLFLLFFYRRSRNVLYIINPLKMARSNTLKRQIFVAFFSISVCLRIPPSFQISKCFSPKNAQLSIQQFRKKKNWIHSGCIESILFFGKYCFCDRISCHIFSLGCLWFQHNFVSLMNRTHACMWINKVPWMFVSFTCVNSLIVGCCFTNLKFP